MVVQGGPSACHRPTHPEALFVPRKRSPPPPGVPRVGINMGHPLDISDPRRPRRPNTSSRLGNLSSSGLTRAEVSLRHLRPSFCAWLATGGSCVSGHTVRRRTLGPVFVVLRVSRFGGCEYPPSPRQVLDWRSGHAWATSVMEALQGAADLVILAEGRS